MSYFLGIASASLVLIAVILLLRRNALRERHAIWWIIAGILALIAGIFPQTLDWLSQIVGISVPINLVFFTSIAILFFVNLQHSSELTNLEEKTRKLAERIAILEMKDPSTNEE
jgi:hypothetical protein